MALKLASTGWRFARYYRRNEPYRLAGPPRPMLRILAPFLVASTLLLFGTGVAMLIEGHGGGELRTLHTFSFIAWGALIGVHVLAYLARIVHDGSADWRRPAGAVVAGVRSRRALLVGSLLAGVVVALATYSTQQSFLSHRHHHHHPENSSRSASSMSDAGVGGAIISSTIFSRDGSSVARKRRMASSRS